jgi:hypothetical protein
MSPALRFAAAVLLLLALSGGTGLAGAPRDGRRDFDFTHGRWKSHIRRLKQPLSGSREWEVMTGTSVVRPLRGGQGSIDEIENHGPGGRMEAMLVRLYSAASRQWTLYWVNQKSGAFDTPWVGEFRNGRGEFHDQEMFRGRAILVRYVWSDITRTSYRFEQSFSDDGGRTWEVNWIARSTRLD